MKRELSPSEHVSPPNPEPMIDDTESGFAGWVTKVYVVGSRSPIFVAGRLLAVKQVMEVAARNDELGMVSLARVNKHGEKQGTIALMVEHIAGLTEVAPDDEISDITIQD